MGKSKDEILKKINLYVIAPVILVLVCVLICLIIKIHMRHKKDKQILNDLRIKGELETQIINDKTTQAQTLCDEIGILIGKLEGVDIANIVNIQQHKCFIALLKKMHLKEFNRKNSIESNYKFDVFGTVDYAQDLLRLMSTINFYSTDFNYYKLLLGEHIIKKFLYSLYRLGSTLGTYGSYHHNLFESLHGHYLLFLAPTKHLQEPDTVAIKYENNIFVYSLGEMDSAVRQWNLYLIENFDPVSVYSTFSSLVKLGKLHLDNLNIDGTVETARNLYYAKKIIAINEDIKVLELESSLHEPPEFRQRSSEFHQKFAKLILKKLGTIDGMYVPKLDVDLFAVPTATGFNTYYHANVKSLNLAIVDISSSLDCIWCKCELSNFQGKFWPGGPGVFGSIGPLKFKVDKCRNHIAALSRLIIAVKQINTNLDNDHRLIEAANAILQAHETLSNARDDDEEIFRVIITILESLKYLGVFLPVLQVKECAVHYRNGSGGTCICKTFSTNNVGNFEEAISIIDPILDWYNSEGNFNVNEFYKQIDAIYVLAQNINNAGLNDETQDAICIFRLAHLSTCRYGTQVTGIVLELKKIFSWSSHPLVQGLAMKLHSNINITGNKKLSFSGRKAMQ